VLLRIRSLTQSVGMIRNAPLSSCSHAHGSAGRVAPGRAALSSPGYRAVLTATDSAIATEVSAPVEFRVLASSQAAHCVVYARQGDDVSVVGLAPDMRGRRRSDPGRWV
jgi:hypothetical protein